jgi:hypothetical protein
MTRAAPAPYIITEAEIARRVGMSPTEWAIAATRLERHGFPKIDPILNARLRGAVDAYFLVPIAPGMAGDGEERWAARSHPARA